jgi:hypothetical protein
MVNVAVVYVITLAILVFFLYGVLGFPDYKDRGGNDRPIRYTSVPGMLAYDD